MRVLTLSDLQKTGGASVACNRIANALSNCGFIVSSTSSDGIESSSHRPLFLGKKYQILSTLFSSKLPNSILENLRVKELHKQLRNLLQTNQPDIINAHNLHSAGWPISLIRTCLDYAPVVWTLHDCWSFLGSYYPTHTHSPSHKLKKDINYFWESLKEEPSLNKLSAVTPSLWMKQQALKSYWVDYDVEAIPNPIPNSYFIIRDRLACKRALNLNMNKSTVLCIAGNLSEERKGGNVLKDILNEDFQNNVEFLLLGKNFTTQNNHEKITNLGFINDEITIQIAYHAADIVIHPAPVDNLPNTVAESISCGTPVLAFNTGGISDLVVSGRSGWLVQKLESHAIIHKLKVILQDKSFEDLRVKTKSYATQTLNMKTVSKRYLKIFNDEK